VPQTVDTISPVLTALTVTPAAIDLTAVDQTVTVHLSAADDLSKVGRIRVELRAQVAGLMPQYAEMLVDTLAFTGDLTITMPAHARAGTWGLTVTLQDRAGNAAVYNPVSLASRGYPSGVSVTCLDEDLSPPLVTSASVRPPVVDVSASSAVATLQFTATDDRSGVRVDPTYTDAFSVVLRSPAGQEIRRFNSAFRQTTGDALNGTWEVPLELPRYSEAATWAVSYLRLADRAGNVRLHTVPTTPALSGAILTVSSSTSDLAPPALNAMSVLPTVIDTSAGAQDVSVTLSISDNLSGVSFGQDTFWNRVWYRSPSGQQVRVLDRTQFSLTSGSPLNGQWHAVVRFPRFSEQGTWRPSLFRLEDATFNLLSLSGTALANLPPITVLRPSLAVDGVMGPTGGTVFDQDYAGVSLQAGPGVIPDGTQVAIDVLDSGLSLPMPSGFEAAGTLFVNIALTPQPAYPLPAPGVMVVLPLRNPAPEGLRLDLMRIDPATGALVPALDSAGQPVVGLVVPGYDGRLALFNGVAGFSTVAGLLPLPRAVAIDVLPGSDDNPINRGSHGLLPIVVFGSAIVDVGSVNPETIVAAGAPAVRVQTEDVNGDGRPDLVVHAVTAALQLEPDADRLTLEARTTDGLRVIGSDRVRIVR
jgi:hypothetical protein